MLFMVIERFEGNDMLPVYQRVRDEGRGLPEGLSYVSSWIEPSFARCFQLMACDNSFPACADLTCAETERLQAWCRLQLPNSPRSMPCTPRPTASSISVSMPS
jgi:Protein of unknown function (DUF3303)